MDTAWATQSQHAPVCIAYSKILTFTTERFSKQLSIDTSKFPLTIDVADGLDGSGSYKVYNQLQTNIDFYVTRPVVLISLKENIDNVQFLMNELIDPQTSIIEDSGLDISGGHVNVRIIRSLFDSKMSATLSGASGASCQLCTANHTQLKELNLIRDGFPINRFIHDAKNLFNDVSNHEEFLNLDSKSRYGLTHPPISEKDILAVSPPDMGSSPFKRA